MLLIRVSYDLIGPDRSRGRDRRTQLCGDSGRSAGLLRTSAQEMWNACCHSICDQGSKLKQLVSS